GNVGELGESYVVNLKLVDVDSKAEVRRISEPLRGNPDELIERVRVAAYRLAAPHLLKGSLSILSDVQGATVMLDGRVVGETPLKTIPNLEIGTHKLRLDADGYTPFAGDVEVRFQKTSEVVVRMLAAPSRPGKPRGRKAPWYATPW